MLENRTATSETALLETVCDRERVAIIFNPASGNEEIETRRATLEALAHAAGLTCELSETDKDQGAAPLAQKAVADGMERVLVSGGDGSVTEAAGALAGTGVALAVIPGGTGNLLSLNIGLPTDAESAIRLALTEKARPMDVGRANGTVFLIMAGMGLDAKIMQDASRKLKDRLGALAYFVAAVRNLRRPRVRYSITVDGRTIRRRAQTVLVANLGRITAGVELVPGADPNDGLLEVAILRAEGLRDLATVAWGAVWGKARDPALLEIHRGREIVIETARPQPVQLDGNDAPPTTRLEVRVEPAALALVRTSDEAWGESDELPAPAALLSRFRHVPALLVGMVAVAALHSHTRGSRAAERAPDGASRFPLWIGLAVVGSVMTVLVSRSLRASPSRDYPAPGSPIPEEEPRSPA